MEKQIGKLYTLDNEIVILYTGESATEGIFTGTVVKSNVNAMPIGHHATDWTWDPEVTHEYVGPVTIDNANYTEIIN